MEEVRLGYAFAVHPFQAKLKLQKHIQASLIPFIFL